MGHKGPERFGDVNKELWLLLSMFVIAGLMNVMADSQRVVLGFYTLPTVVAAYLYGRRHAVLTAYGSVLLAVLVTALPTARTGEWMFEHPRQLADLVAWAGTLLITAYLMGTVCERKRTQPGELHQTYNAVLALLRHFVARDDYTEHHAFRVSEYAARIGARLDLSDTQIEDVRAAGLLHEAARLDISRDLLSKAVEATPEEAAGGSLRRVIPIVLAHHDVFAFDGRASHQATTSDSVPLEARIIAVADMYDSLTSDRAYRKAMSPSDARTIIERSVGTEFDPVVVEAFLAAFHQGELDVRLPAVALA